MFCLCSICSGASTIYLGLMLSHRWQSCSQFLDVPLIRLLQAGYSFLLLRNRGSGRFRHYSFTLSFLPECEIIARYISPVYSFIHRILWRQKCPFEHYRHFLWIIKTNLDYMHQMASLSVTHSKWSSYLICYECVVFLKCLHYLVQRILNVWDVRCVYGMMFPSLEWWLL